MIKKRRGEASVVLSMNWSLNSKVRAAAKEGKTL